MKPFPRDWGRIPQGAVVALILLRIPGTVLDAETTAGMLGGLTGLLIGAFLLVGILRWLVVTVQSRRGDDAPAS